MNQEKHLKLKPCLLFGYNGEVDVCVHVFVENAHKGKRTRI